MSLLRVTLATAMCLAVGGVLCHAQSGKRQRGRPVEFADPKGFDISTNIVQLEPEQPSLKGMENEGVVPLTRLGSRGSLDGTIIPPVKLTQKSIITNKRAQEKLNEKKNWMFATPEDTSAGPTPEEIFEVPEYGPDGKEKKRGPSAEKYMERQRADDESATERNREKSLDDEESDDPYSDTSSRRRFPFDSQSKETPGRRKNSSGSAYARGSGADSKDASVVLVDSEGTDKGGLFGTESENTGPFSDTKGNGMSDVFGSEPPTKAAVTAQKARLETFRQILGTAAPGTGSTLPSSLAGADPLAGLGSASDARSAVSGADALPAVDLEKNPLTASQLDSRVSTLSTVSGSGLADYSGRALNTTVRVPKTEPVRTIAPRPPSFTAPQRAF